MGLLFKGFPAVKVPDSASINESTGEVSLAEENAIASHYIIGQYLGNELMLANSNFMKHHDELLSDSSNDQSLNNVVSAGVYTAALKLILNNSFYQNLQASFNDTLSNALLDYSLYSLIAEKHPSLSYQQYTRSYVPFLTSTKDIAWFNDANNNISNSDLNEFSFSRLAQAATDNSSSKYYLVLKLSNLDTTSELPYDNAQQTASSKKDSEDLSSLDKLVEDSSSVAEPELTVSVIPDEAVDSAESQDPATQDDSLAEYRIVERHFALTASFVDVCGMEQKSSLESVEEFAIYKNNFVNSKIIAQFVFTGTSNEIEANLDKALLSFKSHNREIDLAFICGDEASAIFYSWANHNNIQWLHLHDPFDEQHEDMQSQYNYLLRNDTSAYIPYTGLTGVTAKHDNDDIRDTKNYIFFDREAAETDAIALLNNVDKEQRRIRKLISAGSTDITVDKRYAEFVNLLLTDSNELTVSIDHKRFSSALNKLGYISITCKPDNELTDVCRMYLTIKPSLDKACFSRLIDSTDYSSQSNIEFEQGTRELCAYIKSELKFNLTKLAFERGTTYSQLIDDLEDILLVNLSESVDYQVFKPNSFNRQLLILKHIGVDIHGVQRVAAELTSIALNKALSSNRALPEPISDDALLETSRISSEDEREKPVKRGRGRPKGSKNKSTLAAEKAMTTAATQSTEKRGRGRPKGSKNKSSLAAEKAISTAAPQSTEKRGRGRPKGSKNKSTLAAEKAISTAATQSTEKRGRGRPKGSKNKSTLAAEKAMTTAATQSTEKRGRGRPKGSKNKTSLAAEKAMTTAATQSTEKRGRGRPKGSKNKATLAAEKAMTTAATQSTEKRGRGRPKGSKNKSTLAAEKAMTTAATQSTEKRGRGRPKGSKNKSTLAAEKAMTTAATQSTEKRGRGRPKGSKNKTTLAAEKAITTAATQSTEKRGRGRPKGSKNKSTLAAEKTMTSAATQSTEKRGRGRPKGSKNKTTLAAEKTMTSAASQSTEKRGRGRPKGSKSKTTLAAEKTMTSAASKSTEKRGRGRPTGSKNKTHLDTKTKTE